MHGLKLHTPERGRPRRPASSGMALHVITWFVELVDGLECNDGRRVSDAAAVLREAGFLVTRPDQAHVALVLSPTPVGPGA